MICSDFLFISTLFPAVNFFSAFFVLFVFWTTEDSFSTTNNSLFSAAFLIFKSDLFTTSALSPGAQALAAGSSNSYSGVKSLSRGSMMTPWDILLLDCFTTAALWPGFHFSGTVCLTSYPSLVSTWWWLLNNASPSSLVQVRLLTNFGLSVDVSCEFFSFFSAERDWLVFKDILLLRSPPALLLLTILPPTRLTLSWEKALIATVSPVDAVVTSLAWFASVLSGLMAGVPGSFVKVFWRTKPPRAELVATTSKYQLCQCQCWNIYNLFEWLSISRSVLERS